MKWPRQCDYARELDIEGVTYRVKFCRKLLFEGRNVYGLCNFSEKLISVRMGLGAKFRYEIWWHEVCHAIQHEAGIELAHDTIYDLQGPLARFAALNKKIA